MKHLDENLEERLLRPVQEPWYLIDIMLDQQYHFTTGPAVMVAGVEYQDGNVTGLSIDTEGCVLQVLNDQWRHTTAAMRGDYKRKRVSVSLASVPDQLYVDQDGNYYVDQDGTAYVASNGAPGAHLLSGAISTISSVDAWLSVTVDRDSGRRFPSVRIVPPLANHTRPEGTLIPINQSTYRIATRSRSA